MCGRFTLFHSIQDIAKTFHVEVPTSMEATARYNVAPTQDVVAIMNDDPIHLTQVRWGLIPASAKEESIGSRMINARAETLAEKPSF